MKVKTVRVSRLSVQNVIRWTFNHAGPHVQTPGEWRSVCLCVFVLFYCTGEISSIGMRLQTQQGPGGANMKLTFYVCVCP